MVWGAKGLLSLIQSILAVSYDTTGCHNQIQNLSSGKPILAQTLLHSE